MLHRISHFLQYHWFNNIDLVCVCVCVWEGAYVFGFLSQGGLCKVCVEMWNQDLKSKGILIPILLFIFARFAPGILGFPGTVGTVTERLVQLEHPRNPVYCQIHPQNSFPLKIHDILVFLLWELHWAGYRSENDSEGREMCKMHSGNSTQPLRKLHKALWNPDFFFFFATK